MDEYWSLNHTQWECLYHVVFIPKYRRKLLYGQLRRQLAGPVNDFETLVA
jgi:putative transposase